MHQAFLRVQVGLGHIGVGYQADQAAVIQSLLEIATQKIGLATLQIKFLAAIIFLVHKCYWKIFRVLSNGDTVYEEDDAREKEHKQEEQNIPLHSDPVLYE